MGLFSRPHVETVVDIYNNERFRDFKRILHCYIIQDGKSLVKFHSFDADVYKSLYDAPIIQDIPVNKSYYDVFKTAYKVFTGMEYKDEKSHSGKRDIVEPKVIIDTKNKVLTYILFVKDCDKVNTVGIPQTKFIFDWIDVNEFLETVYSNKYVNYGDAYREFIVFSISQLFNIGDYIKTLKYTSNQEN